MGALDQKVSHQTYAAHVLTSGQFHRYSTPTALNPLKMYDISVKSVLSPIIVSTLLGGPGLHKISVPGSLQSQRSPSKRTFVPSRRLSQ
eukprot:874956-Amphidinium_carterae.1